MTTPSLLGPACLLLQVPVEGEFIHLCLTVLKASVKKMRCFNFQGSIREPPLQLEYDDGRCCGVCCSTTAVVTPVNATRSQHFLCTCPRDKWHLGLGSVSYWPLYSDRSFQLFCILQLSVRSWWPDSVGASCKLIQCAYF